MTCSQLLRASTWNMFTICAIKFFDWKVSGAAPFDLVPMMSRAQRSAAFMASFGLLPASSSLRYFPRTAIELIR